MGRSKGPATLHALRRVALRRVTARRVEFFRTHANNSEWLHWVRCDASQSAAMRRDASRYL